jgi:hypothetical protein
MSGQERGHQGGKGEGLAEAVGLAEAGGRAEAGVSRGSGGKQRQG